MIICTGKNDLRLFKDCSAWEKSCLKERLFHGCEFYGELSAQEWNYLSALNCSADIPDEFAQKAFGETYWADEDFLR